MYMESIVNEVSIEKQCGSCGEDEVNNAVMIEWVAR